jgi:DNA-binding response OmpR family regulator
MGQVNHQFFPAGGYGRRHLLRALIVNPSEDERRYVTAVLNACGFDCVRASDGIVALKYASSYGIDLIVTATGLPVLDADELLSLAQRGAFGKRPPPAIVCGEADWLPEADSLMSVTAIPRPVDAERLIAAVVASFPEP